MYINICIADWYVYMYLYKWPENLAIALLQNSFYLHVVLPAGCQIIFNTDKNSGFMSSLIHLYLYQAVYVYSATMPQLIVFNLNVYVYVHILILRRIKKNFYRQDKKCYTKMHKPM